MIEHPFEKNNIAKNCNEGISRNNEIEFVNKNGENISLSVNWSVIKDDLGNVLKCVCTARDITELKKAQSIVMYQANYDHLTGLSNRYNLEKNIEKMLADNSHNHFFILIDLDKFKQVNDLGGHAAGDELLKQIAFMLQKAVGKENLVARLGGDEFAIIMYDTTRSHMTKCMDTLIQENKAFNFIWEDNSFKVGMSIGAFEINQPGLDWMTIFAAADRACYIAKMNGGNRLHIFSDADDALRNADEPISMISILTDAFENNRFFLEYQPMISTRDLNAVKLFEVLLRLRTKEGMVLEAGAFLSIAERYHKLCELNQWVLREFCKTYHKNKEVFGSKKTIQCHINISNETIETEQFCEFVEHILREYEIPEGVICFEVKESDFISNFIGMTKFVERIKKLGCRFGISNIGYGMPSCSYLKNMPVDCIKINGALIKGMLDSGIDEAVVKSIKEIAMLLNIQTIAEEVDSQMLLQRVRDLEIDFVQGKEIGKPNCFENVVL